MTQQCMNKVWQRIYDDESANMWNSNKNDDKDDEDVKDDEDIMTS